MVPRPPPERHTQPQEPSRPVWIQRIRLKALAWVVAIAIVAVGAISVFAIPALPALGVAVAVVAVALNQIGHRLAQPTCYGCGADISGKAPGTYGVVCTECGTINQTLPQVARTAEPPATKANEHKNV
jgi:hypothetical protein